MFFKKFIQAYTLNKRLKRTDMIVHNDVFGLIEKNAV